MDKKRVCPLSINTKKSYLGQTPSELGGKGFFFPELMTGFFYMKNCITKTIKTLRPLLMYLYLQMVCLSHNTDIRVVRTKFGSRSI